MAEFSDREHLFKSRYGDNPLAAHYAGHGPEPDARIAYREIIRLRAEIEALRKEKGEHDE